MTDASGIKIYVTAISSWPPCLSPSAAAAARGMLAYPSLE